MELNFYFLAGLILWSCIAFFAASNIKTIVLLLSIYLPFEEFVLKFVPEVFYEILRFGWELLILFLLLLLLINKLLKNSPIKRTPIDLWLICFMLTAVGSIVFNNIAIKLGVLGLRTLLRYIVLFYLVVNLSLDEKFIRKLIKWMGYVIFIQCLISVAQFIIGKEAFYFFSPREVKVGELLIKPGYTSVFSERLMVFGTMGRYNLLGNFLRFFMTIFIGIYYKANLSKNENNNLRTLLLIMFVVLILTTLRQSWFGLYVGVLGMLYLLRKKLKVLIVGIVPIIATIILWLMFAGQDLYFISGNPVEDIIKRYLQIFTTRYLEGTIKGDRLGVLSEVSKQVISKSPLVGFGAGIVEYGRVEGLREMALSLKHIDVDPFMKQFIGDVGWTAILTQFGLLGLFFFIMLITSLLKVTLRLYHNCKNALYRGLALGYFAAVIGTIVENFFCYNFTYRPISFYLWLFAGLILNISRHEHNTNRQ